MLGSRELTPEVHHFEFEVPAVSYFAFEPGQFVSVAGPAGARESTRSYSIASPRRGNRFELCLSRAPNGAVSKALFGLKPGDEIEMTEPLGYFTLRDPGHYSVFIAAGTGIAPFRSMLLDHLPRTRPHISLLFGVRCEEGLLYREELEELAAQFPNFRFIPTVSRPTAAWDGRTGRVQSHLDEVLALGGRQRATDVYICGLRDMVEDVRNQLIERNFDPAHIIYEEYD